MSSQVVGYHGPWPHKLSQEELPEEKALLVLKLLRVLAVHGATQQMATHFHSYPFPWLHLRHSRASISTLLSTLSMSLLPALISEGSDFLGVGLEKAFPEAEIYCGATSPFFSGALPMPPRASFPGVLQKSTGRTVGQVELQLEPVETEGLFLLPWGV